MKGELAVYDAAKEAKLLVKHVVDTPLVRLGGLQSSTEYSFVFEPPVEVKPVRAYLEVGMVLRDRVLPKWRLWVNRIAVTREFKPALLLDLDEASRYYAKAIYDLTPVLGSSEPPYRVVVQYEGSPEIELTDISVLALYPDEASTTTYLYYGGALAMMPGEEKVVKLPYAVEGARLSLVVGMPSRAAELVVGCGPREVEVKGLVGYHEISFECGGVARELRMVYRKPPYPFYPRTLVISSLLVERSVKSEPRLSFRSVERTGRGVVVTVANEGSARPELALLVVTSRGLVLKRLELPALEPGAETRVELGEVPEGSSVRLVWRYKGETKVREVRLR